MKATGIGFQASGKSGVGRVRAGTSVPGDLASGETGVSELRDRVRQDNLKPVA